MEIFNGKKEADKILDGLEKKIKKLDKKPVLTIFYIGKNAESELYIKNKRNAAKKIGAVIFCYKFKENSEEKDIIEKINKNNDYPSVDGIIVQLPLPGKFNTQKIINAIDFRKDVDGFVGKNRNLLKKKKPYFFPVLPWAIFIALKSFSDNLKNKKIISLVNSDIFGETLRCFFENKGIKIKYFIGKKTGKFSLKKADIIISARGEPLFIKGEMIKKGAVLIDAGMKIVDGKLKGDVDKESVKDKARFLTPVPGGIGPITLALLLNNVYKASFSKYEQ